jgi:uncharacterized membrane protein YqaE (UPF0057 family)
MNLLLFLLCILLPPLAVVRHGCGTVLVVTVLTLLGYTPGVIAALAMTFGQPTPAESA